MGATPDQLIEAARLLADIQIKLSEASKLLRGDGRGFQCEQAAKSIVPIISAIEHELTSLRARKKRDAEREAKKAQQRVIEDTKGRALDGVQKRDPRAKRGTGNAMVDYINQQYDEERQGLSSQEIAVQKARELATKRRERRASAEYAAAQYRKAQRPPDEPDTEQHDLKKMDEMMADADDPWSRDE
jgi:hypothetical protein